MQLLLYPIFICLVMAFRSEIIIRFLDLLEQVIGRVRNFFSGSYGNGQRLYNEMLRYGSVSQEGLLTEYKFFTALVYSIHKLSCEYGSPLRTPLDYIRNSLLKDIRSEKEVWSEIYSGYGAFSCAFVITWGFSLFTAYLFNKPWDQIFTIFNGLILLWQFLGFVTFRLVFNYLKKKDLDSFEFLFAHFYSFVLYSNVGISINEAFKLSNIERLLEYPMAGSQYFKDRLIVLIDLRHEYGREINDDLKLLIEELWHFYQDRFERLKKRLQIVKFLWLCIFFLVTYLISIYLVLQGLID